MFSLIITIISIALVVALVAATMYYGGSALNQGTVKADAAGFVAGAQQIAAALTMYETDGKGSPQRLYEDTDTSYDYIEKLISNNYLSTVPVVKSGRLNTVDDIASVATTWELDATRSVGTRSVIDPATEQLTRYDIIANELRATVENPDVCDKLHADGNKDGTESQPLYDCTTDVDSGVKTFVFILSKRSVELQQ